MTDEEIMFNDNIGEEEKSDENLISDEGSEPIGDALLEEEGKNLNAIESFAVKQKLLKIKADIDELLKIIESNQNVQEYENKLLSYHKSAQEYEVLDEPVKIVEGIFDGVQMIGNDSQTYNVPPNYASKSKLVEGDLLKLRILKDGAYKYKQIEKAKRINLVGKLCLNEVSGEYFVVADNEKKYKVLQASITYYKGAVGDEVAIIIPLEKDSAWAAVENIAHE